MHIPRLVISALSGGAGKTILSIGLIAALRKQGVTVAPFKKGPDYIDAGWLSVAAGRTCFNLDTFLIPSHSILQSLTDHTQPGDIAIIEGNRGLYDGIDMAGSTSTAELAKLIDAPVVLCLDCTKTTRTMAAVVSGCTAFDTDVALKGVVLNRVAGSRHENVLRKNIEEHCGVPVLGAIPKLKAQSFPERHMGLVPTPEHCLVAEAVDSAADTAARYINLEDMAELAQLAPNLSLPEERASMGAEKIGTSTDDLTVEISEKPRIGVIRDAAFQFYYPENLEALTEHGAELVTVSPLSEETLPDLDGVYIGGGFPETHVEDLSRNEAFRDQIKALAGKGCPIYAECGGLMYLGEALVLEGRTYPMADVLPVVFSFSSKPQGHGYTVVMVEEANPYFAVGSQIRGHEFHYSWVSNWRGSDKDLVFNMERGKGFFNKRDGVCYKNVLATYTHIHALGTPSWAPSMVRNARIFRTQKKGAGK